MSVPALHDRPGVGGAEEASPEDQASPSQAALLQGSRARREARGESSGIYFDYSKNRITDETLGLLLQLGQKSGLRDRIDAMFTGDRINIAENRAVLHTALRAPRGASVIIDGHNVVPAVHDVLDKMAAFSERVRSGAWTGHTGKRIRNVS